MSVLMDREDCTAAAEGLGGAADEDAFTGGSWADDRDAGIGY